MATLEMFGRQQSGSPKDWIWSQGEPHCVTFVLLLTFRIIHL